MAQYIQTFKWNVYGKMTEIIPVAKSSEPTIHFDYDGAGDRATKIVTPAGSTTPTSTYYIRDASGNIMATYHASTTTQQLLKRGFGQNGPTSFTLQTITTDIEFPIYGSSRLGDYKEKTYQYNDITNHVGLSAYMLNNTYLDYSLAIVFPDGTQGALGEFNRILNDKTYELDDHLGNVLVTIKDFKFGQPATNDPNVMGSYLAKVDGYSDYYPNG